MAAQAPPVDDGEDFEGEFDDEDEPDDEAKVKLAEQVEKEGGTASAKYVDDEENFDEDLPQDDDPPATVGTAPIGSTPLPSQLMPPPSAPPPSQATQHAVAEDDEDEEGEEEEAPQESKTPATRFAFGMPTPATGVQQIPPSTPMAQTPSGTHTFVPHEKHAPVLQNIVSTVNLKVALDLKKIALGARNAEYNPKRFAAVIMRIREPKTTALIFRSGKMVCTGARSEENAKLASKKYARIIQKLGYPDAKFTEFKVQNIVASVAVDFPIKLENLAMKHAAFSSYEPELFPGLIYRLSNPKVVLLIFVSGKLVITGAKTKEDINRAFDRIYPVLGQFKKPTTDLKRKL